MTGSGFWSKKRASSPGREEGYEGFFCTLSESDRCDRCGARAYVRVLLPSRRELLFCAHHSRQHASALTKIAVDIWDETHRLLRVAA